MFRDPADRGEAAAGDHEHVIKIDDAGHGHNQERQVTGRLDGSISVTIGNNLVKRNADDEAAPSVPALRRHPQVRRQACEAMQEGATTQLKNSFAPEPPCSHSCPLLLH